MQCINTKWQTSKLNSRVWPGVAELKTGITAREGQVATS